MAVLMNRAYVRSPSPLTMLLTPLSLSSSPFPIAFAIVIVQRVTKMLSKADLIYIFSLILLTVLAFGCEFGSATSFGSLSYTRTRIGAYCAFRSRRVSYITNILAHSLASRIGTVTMKPPTSYNRSHRLLSLGVVPSYQHRYCHCHRVIHPSITREGNFGDPFYFRVMRWKWGPL